MSYNYKFNKNYKKRNCLKCGKDFMSMSGGNRICPVCKYKPIFTEDKTCHKVVGNHKLSTYDKDLVMEFLIDSRILAS